MVKKLVLRSCVVTKEIMPKRDLIRIIKNKDNQVMVDLNGKANGRGAYLKKDLEIIKRAKKTKLLEKSLGVPIPDYIYDELEAYINKD